MAAGWRVLGVQIAHHCGWPPAMMTSAIRRQFLVTFLLSLTTWPVPGAEGGHGGVRRGIHGDARHVAGLAHPRIDASPGPAQDIGVRSPMARLMARRETPASQRQTEDSEGLCPPSLESRQAEECPWKGRISAAPCAFVVPAGVVLGMGGHGGRMGPLHHRILPLLGSRGMSQKSSSPRWAESHGSRGSPMPRVALAMQRQGGGRKARSKTPPGSSPSAESSRPSSAWPEQQGRGGRSPPWGRGASPGSLRGDEGIEELSEWARRRCQPAADAEAAVRDAASACYAMNRLKQAPEGGDACIAELARVVSAGVGALGKVPVHQRMTGMQLSLALNAASGEVAPFQNIHPDQSFSRFSTMQPRESRSQLSENERLLAFPASWGPLRRGCPWGGCLVC